MIHHIWYKVDTWPHC